MVFLTLPILVLTLIVLGYASSRAVRSLMKLSSFFRFPKFLLSFVIVGLGTSLPDILLAFNIAAHTSQVANKETAVAFSELLISSVIGANVIVLCLVLGILVIKRGVFKVRENIIIENFGWIFFVLMIPLFLLIDGSLSFADGIILVVVYAMYLYVVKEEESIFKREELEAHESALFEPREKKRDRILEAIKLLFFLIVVLAASAVVVELAVGISAEFNVSPALIGFTVVAIGLALPEFALDLTALRAREEEIVWGDLIGSFITELTLVLGIAALFGSISFSFGKFFVGYAFMILAFILVFLFAYQKKELTRAQGIALVLLYFVFLSTQVELLLAG